MDRSQEPDRAAEAADLANYFSKFSAALTRLDEELARWKNYEADYQALKTTLLDLPKEISHPVMVTQITRSKESSGEAHGLQINTKRRKS
jgi:hypothetical protein